MKSKQYLDKVVELKPFTKIPDFVRDIIVTELGEIEIDYHSEMWLEILNLKNNYWKNRVYLLVSTESNRLFQTVKLIVDMVKTGILDKYRG